ncbi:MAG: AAA family ATPase [Candidatus Eremiobacteraeota bacterium]|nr:AAA family ATPase [Candidatus Eremiobacteraeota bacterium]
MNVCLRVMHIRTGEQQVFALPETPVLIGRQSGDDEPGKLVILFDPTLSRRHFVAHWNGKRLGVKREKGSKQALFFKGEPLDEFALSPGEHFSSGSTRFQCVIEASSPDKETETAGSEGTEAQFQIRNPYIAGNPVTGSSMFFGRQDIFKFISRQAALAECRTALVLHGGRRTGKTSLLWQIEHGRLGERFIPVYCDLQEMADMDTHSFLAEIEKRILSSFHQHGITIESEATSGNPYEQFSHCISEIEHHLEGDRRYLLLLIDEYEILGDKVRRGQLSPGIFSYFRALMQNRPNISFIFAGTRQLEHLSGTDWSLMFNQARYRKISFLEEQEARRLIESPVRGIIEYEPDAVDEILRLASGHPYFTQLICLSLIETANQENLKKLGTDHIRQVIHSLCLHPVPHLIYLWKELAREEQVVLAALSHILTESSSWSDPREIDDFLARSGISISSEKLGAALDACVNSELLEHSATGACRFRMDLLRHWIAADHPFWQVAGHK